MANPNLSETGLKDEADHRVITIVLKGRWKFSKTPPADAALRGSGGATQLKIKTQYRTQLDLTRD